MDDRTRSTKRQKGRNTRGKRGEEATAFHEGRLHPPAFILRFSPFLPAVGGRDSWSGQPASFTGPVSPHTNHRAPAKPLSALAPSKCNIFVPNNTVVDDCFVGLSRVAQLFPRLACSPLGVALGLPIRDFPSPSSIRPTDTTTYASGYATLSNFSPSSSSSSS
ncbi:hypothetical protein BDV59DRAFT_171517 [Aspergillus ambiguus]|uniref:uncharacterized protein n=1 Tax=Aspergillus ambiguus TaxID=176160 RepID=UPI003CCCC6A8